MLVAWYFQLQTRLVTNRAKSYVIQQLRMTEKSTAITSGKSY